MASPVPAVTAPGDAAVPKPQETGNDAKVEAGGQVAETAPAAQDLPTDGAIRLAIAPWGEVLVDGKMAGVSPPLNEVRLPPGKHRIEVRNGEFPPHRQVVEVIAGKNVRIKHKFQ